MRDRPDAGFTLVELLLAVSVMLVIIVPLTNIFVLGLQTASGGLQDTTNSADAQALAGFFDTDVTNAETVSTTSTSCGGTGTVLLLAWTDGSKSVQVAYRVLADPAMQAELNVSSPIDRLERVRCVDSIEADSTLVARSVLRTPAVSVTCDGGSCTSPTPRRVEMTVVEHTPQLADSGVSGRFTIGVTATRKVTP